MIEELERLVEDGILDRYYCRKEDIKNGSIYQSLLQVSPGEERSFRVYEIALTVHGAYVGSDVEKSNYEVLKEDDCLVSMDDYYGTTGLGIPEDYPWNKWIELVEVLEGLKEYPLIDDEVHSRVKDVLVQEYLKEEVLPRWITYIEDTYGVPERLIDEGEVLTLYREAMEKVNEYPIVETGCLVYLNVDKVDGGFEKLLSELFGKSYFHSNVVYSILYGLKKESKDKRDMFFNIIGELSELDGTYREYESVSDYLL